MLSLVFAEGRRPDAMRLAALQGSSDGLGFSISHLPNPGEGWVELLARGMTFDCHGLAPGPLAMTPSPGVLIGLDRAPGGEAIDLMPGAHLAEGKGLLPVVRTIAGVGARLATLPAVMAVCWRPAGSWMAPDYFRKVVSGWLDGGAFPALGLTTLHREEGGAMISRGLALLTGQELRFESGKDVPPAGIARIAVRLIHELVEHGPLDRPAEFTGPQGEMLRVVPQDGGTSLRVVVE